MNSNYNHANSETRSFNVDENENEYNYYDVVTYHSGGCFSDDKFKKTIERILLTNALD